MTQDQLTQIQVLSHKWAKWSGMPSGEIETQIALNKEIAEAWESRNNREEFIMELVDVCLIKVRILTSHELRYVAYSAMQNTIEDFFYTLLDGFISTSKKLQLILSYCDYNDIDLYNHCLLKLKYNYTRPFYIAKNKELNNV